MEFYCSECGRRESVKTRKAHCECGGLWKLDYKPPKFNISEIDRDEWSMFRYRKFMALEDDSWKSITLGEGMTPIIRLDEDVLLKMDYFMPTLSFKDRGAAVLVSHCKSIGVDNVVQDSSGNAGNSVAATLPLYAVSPLSLSLSILCLTNSISVPNDLSLLQNLSQLASSTPVSNKCMMR